MAGVRVGCLFWQLRSESLTMVVKRLADDAARSRSKSNTALTNVTLPRRQTGRRGFGQMPMNRRGVLFPMRKNNPRNEALERSAHL